MEPNKFNSDISSFFKRIKGEKQITTGDDKITILATPETQKEKQDKQRIYYVSQYIRNKTYARKHVEYFDEYRRMSSTFPIIKAALDIYGEEATCFSGDTEIQLLNGETKTIKELFETKQENFWIYSFNTETKEVYPTTCEKVVDKGVKKVYEVTLDDESKFKVTGDHLWLTSNGEWIKTVDLKEKESLRSFYTRKDKLALNHRIVSVNLIGEERVYDLLNCGKYENFAIKAKEGMVIVHNCRNNKGDVITIKTDNKKVKKLLEECYFKNLKLNSRGYLIIREFCKFGNVYGYLVTRPKVGVADLVFLPPDALVREQLYNPDNLSEYRFLWYGGGGNASFEPWEIVHWKNIEDVETEPYGTSILRPIVDTWRRVVLIREALVIYRITRAPNKLLFKIGTDGMTGDEAFKFAQDMKKEVTKKPLVNPQTGEIDFKYNPMPLSINTPIPLLDGRILTLGQLIDEFNQGKINYVYSIQDNSNQIVPGKIQWVGKNYLANKLIRVWLDNESYVDSAPEHPFILRDGTVKRADELKEKDSLMPLYRKKEILYKNTEYDMVYNPATDQYEFTHQLIANEIENPKKLKTRHHKDFNRFNNSPENLQWVDFYEHKKMHGELRRQLWKNEDIRKQSVKKISETLKLKNRNGLLDKQKEKSSIIMKEWWKNSSNREKKTSLERNRMVELYKSNKGNIRKKNISNKAKEINKLKWLPENRERQLISMSKNLNEETWIEILQFMERSNNPTLTDLVNYINSELISILNKTNKRDCSNITVNWVKNILNKKGYESFREFKKNFILINHKVVKVEVLENIQEDVCCMTIVGLNNENDRHNFAYYGKDIAGNIVESGTFVKNSVEENIFMPVTGDNTNTDVSVLEGAGNLDAVEDYKIIKDDLFAGLKIPKSFLSFEEDLCLDGKTLIPMLDGNIYSMIELSNRFKDGEKLYVYSTDEDGNIAVGEVEYAGPTKKTKQLYEIELDNGHIDRCTANHPWRMRDGSYKRADELSEGDSLMPLYKRINEKGYEEIWHNKEQKWQKTHQLVGEWKYPGYLDRKNTVIHHSSFNKLNNSPEFLIEMDKKEHYLFHSKHAKETLLKPEVREKLRLIQQTPEFKKKCSDSRKQGYVLNPWRRKSVSEANKKYEKTSIMREIYLSLLSKGILSQKGKDNGNYKGLINKEQLLQILNDRTFNSTIELKNYINNLYSETKKNYQIKDLCAILNITKKEFEERYLSLENWKSEIDDLDLVEIEKLICDGYSQKEIYNFIGRGFTSINTFFQKEFNQTFSEWRIAVEMRNNILSKNNLLSILRRRKISSIKELNDFINIICENNKINYTEERVAEILGISVSSLQSKLEGNKAPYNHKVKSIKVINLSEEEYVYDLKVKDYHNFALNSGVFVHNSNKASLGEEDIRFAKTIQRIQSEFIEGLLHIGLVHLYMNGCSLEEMQSFSIEMANPSTGSEKRKWEIMEAKLNVAQKLWDANNNGLNLMSYIDVLKSVFKFTDEEISQSVKSQFNEKKISWRLQQLRENGFYEEPELDKLISQIKGVTGGVDYKDINVFKTLGFEGQTFTETLKKKVDQELFEMFGGNIEVSPTKQQTLLIEGNLKKNLSKMKKDLQV